MTAEEDDVSVDAPAPAPAPGGGETAAGRDQAEDDPATAGSHSADNPMSPSLPLWSGTDLSLLLTRSGTDLLHSILKEEEEHQADVEQGEQNLPMGDGMGSAMDTDEAKDNDSASTVRLLSASTSEAACHGCGFQTLESSLCRSQLSLSAWLSLKRCSQSEMIRRQLVVMKRVFGAIRQQQNKEDARQQGSMSESGAADVDNFSSLHHPVVGATAEGDDGAGTNAMLEIGVSTGISLVFALLRQNWSPQAAPGSARLCTDVLRTLLTTLSALPPLSLADRTKLGSVGEKALEQASEFLAACVDVRETGGDEQGSRLALEILLNLAVQRGSLSKLLQWIHLALRETAGERKQQQNGDSSRKKRKVSRATVEQASARIRSANNSSSEGGGGSSASHSARFRLACSLEDDDFEEQEPVVDLYEAAIFLLAEVATKCQRYALSCLPRGRGVSSCGGGGGGLVYTWGTSTCPQAVRPREASDPLAYQQSEKLLTPLKMQGVSDVQRVIGGPNFSFVLHGDGRLSAVGGGFNNRLFAGDVGPDADPASVPVCRPLPPPLGRPNAGVVDVSISKRAHDGHFLAVTASGELYSWGDGDFGKLGHGSVVSHRSPKRVTQGRLFAKVVVQVSAGTRHSAAVTDDGLLFTWGEGDFGRLGHGDSQSRMIPTRVKDIGPVKQVSCGSTHTLALSKDGRSVWSFGAGDHGKLGHGDTARLYRPQVVSALQGQSFSKVLAGQTLSLCLAADGKLWSWGSSACLGQGRMECNSLLLPRVVERLLKVRVVDVSLGDNHCLALSEANVVYSWGVNSGGQCGLAHAISPVFHPQPVTALSGMDIHQISAGGNHSLASTALPSDRKAVLWNKPFCAELSPDTFSSVLRFLSTAGIEMASSSSSTEPMSSEDEAVLLSYLSVLENHFLLAAESEGKRSELASADTTVGDSKGDVGQAKKAALERILYRFVDLPSLPQVIRDAVCRCLDAGVSGFLLAPLGERVTRACALLHVSAPSAGQELNLRLLLRSLDDHNAVSELAARSRSPCEGQQGPSADEAEVKKGFLLTKTLLIRIFGFYIKHLPALGSGKSTSDHQDACDAPSKALREEEKRVLSSLLTRIALCGVAECPSGAADMLHHCLTLVKLLLSLSKEFFHTCALCLRGDDKVSPSALLAFVRSSCVPQALNNTLLSVRLARGASPLLRKYLLQELLDLGDSFSHLGEDLLRMEAGSLASADCKLLLDLRCLLANVSGKLIGDALEGSRRVAKPKLVAFLDSLVSLEGGLDCSLEKAESVGELATCVVDTLKSTAFTLEKRLHTVDSLLKKLLGVGVPSSEGDAEMKETTALLSLNPQVSSSVKEWLSKYEGVVVEEDDVLAGISVLWLAVCRHQGHDSFEECPRSLKAMGELAERIASQRMKDHHSRAGESIGKKSKRPNSDALLERTVGVSSLYLSCMRPRSQLPQGTVAREIASLATCPALLAEDGNWAGSLARHLEESTRMKLEIEEVVPMAVRLVQTCRPRPGSDDEEENDDHHHHPSAAKRRSCAFKVATQTLLGFQNVELLPGSKSGVVVVGPGEMSRHDSKGKAMLLAALLDVVQEALQRREESEDYYQYLSLLFSALSVEMWKAGSSSSLDWQAASRLLSQDAAVSMHRAATTDGAGGPEAVKLAFVSRCRTCLAVISRLLDTAGPGVSSMHTGIASFLLATLSEVDKSADLGLATDFVGLLCLVTGSRGGADLLRALSTQDSTALFAAVTSVYRRPGGTVALRLACSGVLKNLLCVLSPSNATDAREVTESVFSLIGWTLFEDSVGKCYWSEADCSRAARRTAVEAQFEVAPRRRRLDRDLTVKGGAVTFARSGGERVAAVLKRGFRGAGTVASWRVRVLEDTTRGHNEAVGVGVTTNPADPFRESWLLLGRKGGLVRGSDEQWTPSSVPSFSKGDVLRFVADLSDGTLSVSKNCGEWLVLFDDLPLSEVDIFPVVTFEPLGQAAKVEVADVSWSSKTAMSPPSSELGGLHCSPAAETSAQSLVRLLRHLYEQQSAAWREPVTSHVEQVLDDAVSMALVKKARVGCLAGDDAEAHEKTKAAVDSLADKVYPVLAFLAGVDGGGMRIGKEVLKARRRKYSGVDKADTGVVVSCSEEGVSRVLWRKSGKVEAAERSELASAEEDGGRETKFAFDFSSLLGSNKLKLLSALSACAPESKLAASPDETDRIAERHLSASVRGNNDCKKKKPLSLGGKKSKAKRTSGLVSDDAVTSASVERLTNILVSSIIDEVTGKKPAAATATTEAAATPRDECDAAAGQNTGDVFREVPPRGEEKEDGEKISSEKRKTISPSAVESTLVKAALLQTAADRVLLKLLDSDACDPVMENSSAVDSDSVTVHLRDIVRAFWGVATSDGTEAMPLAAPTSIADLERSVSIIRATSARSSKDGPERRKSCKKLWTEQTEGNRYNRGRR